MDANRGQDQLSGVRKLFPIQRQILSDLCRGAQVVQCYDGTFRSCVEIAGRSRISVYGLDAAAMGRLCAAVWQITTGYFEHLQNTDSAKSGYDFYYIPAVRRLEVSDLITLTIRAPGEAFEGPPAQNDDAGLPSTNEDHTEVITDTPRNHQLPG
jgi:hypothetical protein